MADKLKDDVDRRLESLFGSDPVRDDGFSMRVVSRVRRRMWIRRLALPVAIAAGLAISAKPLLQFATALPQILNSIPGVSFSLAELPISNMLQSSSVVWGIVLLASVLMAGRLLEE